MTSDKIDKILSECYSLIYKNAEPPADFNELLKNAKIDEHGRKDIGFENYTIDEDVFYKIIDDTLKKYKVPKYMHERFKTTLLLGASPKFKNKKEEK